jgi:hypothetical protein
MPKLLIVALALGAFAMTGLAIPAEAEFGPCIGDPKDNLPCFMTPQRPQPSKVRVR